jgi:hypothetical protein
MYAAQTMDTEPVVERKPYSEALTIAIENHHDALIRKERATDAHKVAADAELVAARDAERDTLAALTLALAEWAN